MSGRLVVCPTPIGNLEDVTLRVLSALREADVVACEDTRRTRVLLDRYGVSGRLVSYHEHNEQARSAELVARMRSGDVVALVSDAGMPLVSDPGYVLVRACVAAGLPVEVLPGPSAAITALVASGLPSAEWRFVGFLPRKKGELRAAVRSVAGTIVAFESPQRVPATLGAAGLVGSGAAGGGLPGADEGARGGGARDRGGARLAIFGRAAAWGGRARGGARLGWAGAGAGAGASSELPGLDALRRLVAAGAHPRKAAGVVAELTGGSANELYRALTAGG